MTMINSGFKGLKLEIVSAIPALNEFKNRYPVQTVQQPRVKKWSCLKNPSLFITPTPEK